MGKGIFAQLIIKKQMSVLPIILFSIQNYTFERRLELKNAELLIHLSIPLTELCQSMPVCIVSFFSITAQETFCGKHLRISVSVVQVSVCAIHRPKKCRNFS